MKIEKLGYLDSESRLKFLKAVPVQKWLLRLALKYVVTDTLVLTSECEDNVFKVGLRETACHIAMSSSVWHKAPTQNLDVAVCTSNANAGATGTGGSLGLAGEQD